MKRPELEQELTDCGAERVADNVWTWGSITIVIGRQNFTVSSGDFADFYAFGGGVDMVVSGAYLEVYSVTKNGTKGDSTSWFNRDLLIEKRR